MSSLILENLIKQKSKINFDFSKSFKSNQALSESIDSDLFELPLSPNESTNWQEHYNANKIYLEKLYTFKNVDHVLYLVKEVLTTKKNQSEVEIFIKNNTVKVFVGSVNTTEITSVEIELTKLIDEIYDDIFYIR